jgi:hypothetical protein
LVVPGRPLPQEFLKIYQMQLPKAHALLIIWQLIIHIRQLVIDGGLAIMIDGFTAKRLHRIIG